MNSSQDIKALAIGVLRTPPSAALHDRLAEIHREVEGLLSDFKPDAVAIEQVFFQNNVRTAMGVGQASGIVLALAARAGCDVAQYTPSQVKNTVAGWGGATKEQIDTTSAMLRDSSAAKFANLTDTELRKMGSLVKVAGGVVSIDPAVLKALQARGRFTLEQFKKGLHSIKLEK
jgi:crossover junction endodeoxyribonuclease RuvC